MTSPMKKKRVLVAMSGGVDSSVAAALLVEQGYEVIGATMQVWDYSKCDIQEGSGTCCSSIDVDDARSVADKLNIPFYIINCEEKFKETVIDPFIQDYLVGKTPLPCVNCNTFLKFDHLIKKMKELECDYLATGHYAKIIEEGGKFNIYTSEDSWKDQTYFLFTIEKEYIKNLLFPVGSITKKEVREHAVRFGLDNARKKDSTGICFVGDKGYSSFIESQVKPEVLNSKRGNLKRYPTGEVLAQHNGIHLFTYGQSKGLGMSYHEKLFVLKIDAHTNDVWLGDEKYLYSSEVLVDNPHLLEDINENNEYQVKIRYQHQAAEAKIIKIDDKQLKIIFSDSQRAVTPGQAAVIYKNKKLVGGGWIRL